MTKTDLRVIKTKRNLYEGLARLLEEKPFESIKIKDICEKSLINRSTFYDHFNSKSELLDAMIEERIKEIFDSKNEDINYDNYREKYYNYAENYINFIDKDINIHRKMLEANNKNIVRDMTFEKISRDINITLERINVSDIPTEVLSRFYVYGFSELVMLHLENPEKYNKDDILKYVKQILYKSKK